MKNINLYFPEILFTSNEQWINTQPEHPKQDLEAQKALHAELLRICQLQKRLIDEQSTMIVEMLEGMGK